MRQHSEQLQQLIAPVVEGLGFELWGIEYHLQGSSALLRLFIDSPDGVKLDDCAAVSDQVSGVLDVEDPIPVPYRLEVSSPGLDRPLFSPEQFLRYQDHRIKLRTTWPIQGRRNFVGVIREVGQAELKLDVDGELVLVPFESVARARLIPEF